MRTVEAEGLPRRHHVQRNVEDEHIDRARIDFAQIVEFLTVCGSVLHEHFNRLFKFRTNAAKHRDGPEPPPTEAPVRHLIFHDLNCVGIGDLHAGHYRRAGSTISSALCTGIIALVEQVPGREDTSKDLTLYETIVSAVCWWLCHTGFPLVR